MYTFTILGIKDSNARNLEQKVNAVIGNLPIRAKIEHLENVDLFLQYKLSKIPALMIDNKVLFSGNEKSSREIRKIILAYLQNSFNNE